MTHPTNTIRALALLVLLAPVLTACRWSVPADPGRNYQLRSRPAATEVAAYAPAPGQAPAVAEAAHDDGARALYMSHCGRCHEPFDPGAVEASAWPFYVQKYGPRAGLFGANRTRVLAWLQANAP